ncbi:MAG: GntP family permease [Bacteroidales bacterium]|jgi:GntP family gluconate:H+ symporter|nr:GntP family permease [Bacteroidales bacterium]
MNILTTSILVAISIIAIIILTSKFKLNAFIALFAASLFLAFATLPAGNTIGVLKDGFGGTMSSIGFLVILGAIIGITLDKTGGTLSIAKYILSKTGEKRSAAALGMTGFITGLPIFCDSGFIILSGLARSLGARAGLAMPFVATVLATSLYSVHCLIPPHPGALAAAGIMNANTGQLVIMGILFAIPGALAAFMWSKHMSRTCPPASATTHTQPDTETLPSPFVSFLPVFVPLLLITMKSLLPVTPGIGSKIITVAGEPVYALSAGVVLALALLTGKRRIRLNDIFKESIEKAGPILIITAAGGMFGAVIKATGTGETLGRLLSDANMGLLVPFIIAAVMKTAQGSSTVAIITAASLVSPMLPALGLHTEQGRLFATLAMGAGSMFVSHANDSYFWVISNFSGIDSRETLKVYSTSTIVMGCVVFALVWLASVFML